MSTKIRRCLYIGLGGTGMNSILNTKKMFIDTYGEVPPMVGFLGIDTDGGAYKKTILSTNGDQVGLLPREQHSVQVEEPRPIYEHNKEQLDWFPQENLYALTRMMDGAGQIRSNGRFALWYHAGSIVTKILNVLRIDPPSRRKSLTTTNIACLIINPRSMCASPFVEVQVVERLLILPTSFASTALPINVSWWVMAY